MAVTFNLDDPCGSFFTYRDLIHCGKTWNDRAGSEQPIPNLPREHASLEALSALCIEVLDPLTRMFGRPTLTYGFASKPLTTQIGSHIAPGLDQHAAHERHPSGRAICTRLGAAVDLLVPGRKSSDVARWIFAHTPFDRLYLYGDDRPVHVSFGPEHSRSVVELVEDSTGRRIPKKLDWKGT
jgi:hypothetical protein